MTKKKQFFAALILLISSGVLSAVMKYELLYDFFQYHYYNGFAFWNERLGVDVAPASVATYYNPLLDGLTYALITAFRNQVNIYFFIQGLWFGALMFAAYKTAMLFFDANTKAGRVFGILAILVCATGSATWFQLGTSTHEIETAVLTMTAFYLLLRDEKRFLTAGLLLGMAAGFKLTAAIYCVSTGLTLILFYKTPDRPLKSIAVFALGGLAGFLIVDGFWMMKLWRLYGNPFFPFWNAVFKSPYYPEVNYVDTLHLSGKTGIDHLLAPFLMAYQSGFSSNFISVDPRMAAAVIVGASALLICRKQRNKRVVFGAVLTLISFAVWDVVSFNARFLIPVEQLAGVLIVYAFYRMYLAHPELTVKTAVPYAAAVLCLYAFLATPVFSQPWGRMPRLTFLTEQVELPPDSLVQAEGGLYAAVLTDILRDNPTARSIGYAKNRKIPAWNMALYGQMKHDAEKTADKRPKVFLKDVRFWGKPTENSGCKRLQVADFVESSFYNSYYLCKKAENN